MAGVVDARQTAIERQDVRLTLQQLEATKEQLGDRFEAVVEAHTGGDSVHRPALRGLLSAVIPLAMATAAGVGLGSVGAGLGIALLGAPRIFEGARELKDWIQLPRWNGSRTFHIGGQKSAPQASQRPQAEKLVEHLRRGMGLYPGARSVLLVGGHGLGYYTSAGMPTHELGKAMKSLPEPVDIALFDSCLMGNLEALTQLGDRARIAITAEGLMPTQRSSLGALPLGELLEQAANQPSLTEAARAMVDRAADSMLQQRGPDTERVVSLRERVEKEEDPELKRIHKSLLDLHAEPLPELAAVDLHRLQSDLLPALDVLGQQLTQKLGQGGLESIRRAAAQSQLEASKAFFDLGRFLDGLAGLVDVKPARQALQQSLLHHRGEADSGLSGISVQLVPLAVAPEGLRVESDPISQPSDLRGLPRGWVNFTEVFRQALASTEPD